MNSVMYEMFTLYFFKKNLERSIHRVLKNVDLQKSNFYRSVGMFELEHLYSETYAQLQIRKR